MVQFIGYHTRTKEISVVSVCSFVCLTVDMIILPVFLNMQLGDNFHTGLIYTYRVKFNDFNDAWFASKGEQITTTMILFTFIPYIDLIVEKIVLEFKRLILKNKLNGNINTDNDLLQYVGLRAGPRYLYHYSFLYTNLIVFTCLLIGPSLPILYFCGLLGIFNLYIVERLALAYFYRKPPVYSEQITLVSIDIMVFIPAINLISTLWLSTNKQMFENVIDAITVQDQLRLSHHHWEDLWDTKKLKPFHQHLQIAFCTILFGTSVWTLLKLVKEMRNFGQVYFQDGALPDYFKALRKESLEEFRSDETDFKTYGFRLLSDENL